MADKKLVLKQQMCPRPLIAVMSALKTLEKGQTLAVECTDPSTKQSIPKLCERAGFAVLESAEADGVIRFTIKK